MESINNAKRTRLALFGEVARIVCINYQLVIEGRSSKTVLQQVTTLLLL